MPATSALLQPPQTEVLVRAVDGRELVRVTLPPGEYILGSDAACHLRVVTAGVSWRHAQLTIHFDHATIEDLGSASGTQVNGQAIEGATRLWPGQRIQMGEAVVELRRQKTLPLPDVSLAPNVAITRDILPEEILRDRKYDIGRIVAQGGMGAILSAKEEAIDRSVAMKVMLDGASPDDLVRFIAEARVTGQLEHPNIVPVHELGVDENDQVFYTMKFVKGITLRKVLELMAAGTKATLEKYPLGTLLTIFQKVCDAVAFAHSKGVIHRDLKPENIMLGDFGEVLLMDWGLAKVVGRKEVGSRNAEVGSGSVDDVARSLLRAMPEAAGATMGGTIMGTPQYMSPEQARGEVDVLDARADIYALGAILYHVLALRPSVQGDDAYAIVEKVGRGEVDPLESSLQAVRAGNTQPKGWTPTSISASLAAVVRKAMALDKAQRYASVADLQADLTAYQNGFATKAEHAGLAKQLVLLIKRHRGIFATAAAAWLLITALAVWFILNLQAKEKRAIAGEHSAKEAEAVAVQEKETARRALTKSSLSLAEAQLREANGPAMQAALAEVPEDLRDSTWSYLMRQSDTSFGGIGDVPHVFAAAPHPKLPSVFAIDSDEGIVFRDVRQGKTLWKLGLGTHAKNTNCRIALSPDGELLAASFSRSQGIAIFRTKDGRKLRSWESPATRRLEFNRDGRLLLQQEVDTKLINVWDTATGTLKWTFVAGAAVANGAFTPDGQFVLRHGYHEGLTLVRAEDGSVVREFGDEKAAGLAMAIRPDGKQAVVSIGNGRLKCLDLQDGRSLFELRPHDTYISGLGYTPDGRRFVTATTLLDGRLVVTVRDAESGTALQSLLGGFRVDGTGLSVHPLSGELAITGPKARMWDLVGTPAKWIFPGRGERSAAFWGADDILFVSADGKSRGALRRLQETGAASDVEFSPDLYIKQVGVSADGTTAAIGWNKKFGVARKVGEQIELLSEVDLPSVFTSLRVSPTGDRVALFGVDYNRLALQIWNSKSGQKAVELEEPGSHGAFDAAWTPDGKQLLGSRPVKARRGNPGSEEQIVRWDATTGKVLRTATHPTAVDRFAMAPDGRRFAEAGLDRMLRIRDVESLAVQKEFRIHDGPITALAWHPTKPIVATASTDLSVRLWDIETGRQLEELYGTLQAPATLTFSPSGKRLACAGPDGFVRVWEPVALGEPKAQEKK